MGFFDSMAAAWTPTTVGEKLRGEILDTFEKQQTEGDMVNGKFVPSDRPKFFKNNAPAMSLVVVLRVAEETNDDNGQRSLYVNRPSRLFTAVAQALKAVGAKEPAVGDVLEVTYTGLDPESAQKNAKMFSALYVKADSAVAQEVANTPVTNVAQTKEEVSAEAQALLAQLAALGVKA